MYDYFPNLIDPDLDHHVSHHPFMGTLPQRMNDLQPENCPLIIGERKSLLLTSNW
jgi:hypothetical protein